MIRDAASKVMWVGRATVFLVGLTVIPAVVLGIATAAFAGTGVGDTFNLGRINTVNRISHLWAHRTTQCCACPTTMLAPTQRQLFHPGEQSEC